MRRKYRPDRPNHYTRAIIVVLTIIALILVGILIYWAVSYEKEVDVEVLDRWWTSHVKVTYTTSYTTVETVSEYVCTGFGDNRVCRTEMRTVPRTVVETHTRCSDSASGRELPARSLPEPCTPRWRDRVSRWAEYRIRYRVSESMEERTAGIGLEHWGQLAPGERARLILNLFGNVRELEKS